MERWKKENGPPDIYNKLTQKWIEFNSWKEYREHQGYVFLKYKWSKEDLCPPATYEENGVAKRNGHILKVTIYDEYGELKSYEGDLLVIEDKEALGLLGAIAESCGWFRCV